VDKQRRGREPAARAGGAEAGARAAVLCPLYPDNHLLNALLGARADGLARMAERIQLAAGATVHLAGRPLSHVYFPLTAVISAQQLLEDGCAAEIIAVGSEGMAGLAACLGADGTLAPQLVVSAAGSACRVPVGIVRLALRQPGPALSALLRYARSELTQTGHLSACGCHHGTEQRACRWLLCMLERRPGGAIDITHDTLAGILGVRRESITEVLRTLRDREVLRTTRGQLQVVDAGALRQLSCECYQLLRAELLALRSDLRRRACLPPQIHRCAGAQSADAGGASLPPVRWRCPN
jgi:CRP-like cAMP-binding protein